MISIVYYTALLSTPVVAKDLTTSKYMQTYRNCYHEKAPIFSALAYDAVYLVKQAIAMDRSDDSSKIKNFNRVTGKITVNKSHDPEKPTAIEQLTSGKVSNKFKIK